MIFWTDSLNVMGRLKDCSCIICPHDLRVPRLNSIFSFAFEMMHRFDGRCDSVGIVPYVVIFRRSIDTLRRRNDYDMRKCQLGGREKKVDKTVFMWEIKYGWGAPLINLEYHTSTLGWWLIKWLNEIEILVCIVQQKHQILFLAETINGKGRQLLHSFPRGNNSQIFLSFLLITIHHIKNCPTLSKQTVVFTAH